jgi:hypothetical protein
MNPGPSDEIGKVAIGVIGALRTQPALLMLILFNALFLGAVFWAVRDQRSYQHEIMKVMLEQNEKAQQLLSRCVVPPHG